MNEIPLKPCATCKKAPRVKNLAYCRQCFNARRRKPPKPFKERLYSYTPDPDNRLCPRCRLLVRAKGAPYCPSCRNKLNRKYYRNRLEKRKHEVYRKMLMSGIEPPNMPPLLRVKLEREILQGYERAVLKRELNMG